MRPEIARTGLAAVAAGGAVLGVLQGRVPRVDPRQMETWPVAGAQVHAGSLHAARLQVAQDLGVASLHGFRQRHAHLAGEQPARFSVLGHRFDGAVGGQTDRLGPQRVAVLVAADRVEQAGHVRRHFTQFPFAVLADLRSDAVGVHALLDFVVVDQAEGLPVCRFQPPAAVGARRKVLADAIAQLVSEHQMEVGHVAAQVELRRQQRVALARLRDRKRQRAQQIRDAVRHRRDGRVDQADSRIECDLLAGICRVHRGGGGARPHSPRVQVLLRAGRSRKYGPKNTGQAVRSVTAAFGDSRQSPARRTTSSGSLGSRAAAPRLPAERPAGRAGLPSSAG